MAECLVALGSNLGDRCATLRHAVDLLGRTPRTQVVARSAWRETPPVGGPTGQGAFLNGAIRLATGLDPDALYAELVRIESQLGRVRTESWSPRTLDLDLLLYGNDAHGTRDALTIPHPRMHYRRFVLEGAAEVAPWMVHPPSGWTVARLLAQLDAGGAEVAVAAADATLAQDLSARLKKVSGTFSAVRPWTGGAWNPGPRVLLAVGALPGTAAPERRKMLNLPPTGPIAWLSPGNIDSLVDEARTVLLSAQPLAV